MSIELQNRMYILSDVDMGLTLKLNLLGIPKFIMGVVFLKIQ